MSSIKTFVTSFVTGAVTSAVTTFAIAKITRKPPDPVCAATGSKVPARECAALDRLAASEAKYQAELSALRGELASLTRSATLSADPRFWCATTAGAARGECFRSFGACAAAAGASELCWNQPEATCFTGADGAARCASAPDLCVELATAAGKGDEAKAACQHTRLEPVPVPTAAPSTSPPVPAPAPPPARRGTPAAPGGDLGGNPYQRAP